MRCVNVTGRVVTRRLQTVAWMLALGGLVLTAPGSAAELAARRLSVERPSRAEVPPQPVFGPLKNVFSAASASDPVGDTLAPGPDLTGLMAEFTPGALILDLSFATAIDPDTLDGFIDIDADENGNTGTQPWTDALKDQETTGMGNEFYVDLFTFDTIDLAVDVVEEETQTVVARAPVELTTTRLTVTIPLALLGDNGRVDVAAVVLLDDQASDVVPNQGSVKSSRRPIQPPPCASLNSGNLTGCQADDVTICLNRGRFEVTSDWATLQGTSGDGMAVQLTDDSGYFWFFDEDNIELTVKVLNACSSADRYWVFASGLTNVQVELRVRDTLTGQVQVCRNPLETTFRPILDTNAFATCP